jgi:hypothetical protein
MLIELFQGSSETLHFELSFRKAVYDPKVYEMFVYEFCSGQVISDTPIEHY